MTRKKEWTRQTPKSQDEINQTKYSFFFAKKGIKKNSKGILKNISLNLPKKSPYSQIISFLSNFHFKTNLVLFS